jgi:hypothetical protein
MHKKLEMRMEEKLEMEQEKGMICLKLGEIMVID